MSTVVSTSLKTAYLNAEVSDIGSGGFIEICTASYTTVLAVIPFNTVAGTVSGTTLTFSGMPKTVTASNSGTPALARYKKADGTVVRNGITVGLSGSSPELVVDSMTFTAGQNVTLNSATFTL